MRRRPALIGLLLTSCFFPSEGDPRPGTSTSESSSGDDAPTSTSDPIDSSDGSGGSGQSDEAGSGSSPATSGTTSTGAESTGESTGRESTGTEATGTESGAESTGETTEIGDASECPGFSTSWCIQERTLGQETRCLAVPEAGLCVGPIIRYGGADEGIPAPQVQNDPNLEASLLAWCEQLGFGELVEFEIGDRECEPPWSGRVWWCEGYDEPGPHWCDVLDGFWMADAGLGFHTCTDVVLSIRCA